jgi:hypothetical protein
MSVSSPPSSAPSSTFDWTKLKQKLEEKEKREKEVAQLKEVKLHGVRYVCSRYYELNFAGFLRTVHVSAHWIRKWRLSQKVSKMSFAETNWSIVSR